MKVGIIGAGAIGGYVGTVLSAAGLDVTMVGRPWLCDLRDELEALSIKGEVRRPTPSGVVTEDPAALAEVDVCLVTVKSGATRAAGQVVLEHAPASAAVVSLQNGIGNVAVLTELLGDRVVPGMVTFNVVVGREDRAGQFKQATDGPIVLGPSRVSDTLVAAWSRAGEDARVRADMPAVQLGKLLLNLNNGLCAVTGLPLVEFLSNRTCRRAASACIREGLAAARAQNRRVASLGFLTPGFVARLLPVPDAIFTRLAKKMVSFDPAAKPSTLQDIEANKPTEVDHLNGAIVEMAHAGGIDAPLNAWIVETVHALESQATPEFVRPEDIPWRRA